MQVCSMFNLCSVPKLTLKVLILLLAVHKAACFWDVGTTTPSFIRTDITPRQSFFRWQIVHFDSYQWWFPQWDWYTIKMNRKLRRVCGLSIDFLPLGTATLLNRRTLVTSANFLEPYITRHKDVRIWCLGREGVHTTPYRYRVWRIRRLLPKSMNPEHYHGARGVHCPRHDIMIVHSLDQIYTSAAHHRHHYAYPVTLVKKHETLGDTLWFAGSGYEYLEHIAENYKIFWGNQTKDEIVDCSKYLPKWWGKFICIINSHGFAGVPNGGGLFVSNLPSTEDVLVGLGCFEIRYNEERIMVFTDLRYYVDWLHIYANITRGEYYEYAYPQWSIVSGWLYDSGGNDPYIPRWQIKGDYFPLGKRKKK